jgi:hypothetical protein
MFRDGEYYDAIHPDEQAKTVGEYDIPLYTHPAKILTDEEIKAVYGEYFDVKNCDWLHLQCIQAILRKAQEK